MHRGRHVVVANVGVLAPCFESMRSHEKMMESIRVDVTAQERTVPRVQVVSHRAAGHVGPMATLARVCGTAPRGQRAHVSA